MSVKILICLIVIIYNIYIYIHVFNKLYNYNKLIIYTGESFQGWVPHYLSQYLTYNIMYFAYL